MPGGTGTTGRRIVDRLKARGLPVGGDGWTGLVLGDALVAMALVTGLNYTFSVAVMPNLGGADDRTFVETVQRFNENPAFPSASPRRWW